MTGTETFVVQFVAAPTSSGGRSDAGRFPSTWARCRIHGVGCGVPWGYDEAHTDQRHPYTVEQLAARTDGPHFYAYPNHEAYLAGWKLWQVLHRDGRLNRDEVVVRQRVRLEHHRPRLLELGFTEEQMAEMFGLEAA